MAICSASQFLSWILRLLVSCCHACLYFQWVSCMGFRAVSQFLACIQVCSVKLLYGCQYCQWVSSMDIKTVSYFVLWLSWLLMRLCYWCQNCIYIRLSLGVLHWYQSWHWGSCINDSIVRALYTHILELFIFFLYR